MDAFYERLIVRAATIDELLSDKFETLPGQKSDADLAARRLAAWCQSCASGDWSLFNRRLKRDGLSIGQVLTRFATVRRSASAPRRRGSMTQSGSRRRCKAEPTTPNLSLRLTRPSLCVRTPVRASGRTSRGAALVWHRRTGIRQPERLCSRLFAPFASQAAVQPLRSGALRTLRQGAEGSCNARPDRGTANRRRRLASRSVHRRNEDGRSPAIV